MKKHRDHIGLDSVRCGAPDSVPHKAQGGRHSGGPRELMLEPRNLVHSASLLGGRARHHTTSALIQTAPSPRAFVSIVSRRAPGTPTLESRSSSSSHERWCPIMKRSPPCQLDTRANDHGCARLHQVVRIISVSFDETRPDAVKQ